MKTNDYNLIWNFNNFCEMEFIPSDQFLEFIKNNTDGWRTVIQYESLLTMLWKEYLAVYLAENVYGRVYQK